MNGHAAKRVLVDIETVLVSGAELYLDPVVPILAPDLSLITPAKNLVDPAKVAADLDKRKQAAVEAYHDQCQQQETKRRELLERCALDLDLCRIVALGWMEEDDDEPTVLLGKDEAFEQSALEAFWSDLESRTTVGYNSIGFDLPILLRRSLYLGVDAPMLNLDKYRSNHIDLQQRLSLNGTKPYRSLNWYCKRFGLDVPADASSGKDIGQLVTEGKWEAVAAHCRADVLKTKALAQRLGLLKTQAPVLEPSF